MAYLTWDALFNPGATQIATISDAKSKLRQSVALISTNTDTEIQLMMKACSDDMREQVELRMQDYFPEQIAYYIAVYNRAERNMDSAMFPGGFPNLGYISTYGSFVSLENRVMTDDPQVFLYLGTPPNDAYNNYAENGAWLVDRTPSRQRVFINRGTKAANSWEVFDASGLPDYLVNPSVLERAFIYGSCYFFFEGIATGVISNNNLLNMELYARQEDRFKEKYGTLMQRALALLKPDISNGGYATSMDLRSQKKQWGIR